MSGQQVTLDWNSIPWALKIDEGAELRLERIRYTGEASLGFATSDNSFGEQLVSGFGLWPSVTAAAGAKVRCSS